ncbi:MAG TPA: PilZ domain-containing protein [Phycisphaerales bacterium]|nr:PilZ domain-containing protein [Phycisphaerales bacterium]
MKLSIYKGEYNHFLIYGALAMSAKDQRSAPRVLHSITAKVKVGENPVFGVKTMDLSQGGALLDSPYQLPLGEKLELAFKLGKHELNPTLCEVRRVESAFGGRRYCVAVQFSQPNFQLIELVKRDLKNWELESEAASLVSSWSDNPMRTFW